MSGISDAGVAARRIAAQVLMRVSDDGAYANIALRHALDCERLEPLDSKLVTDLVYGTLRRQRSCDYLVGRFLVSEPPPTARAYLRLGAYQIAFRPDIPSYASVSATVSSAPRRFRGLCNAVLRKVSGAPVEFPSLGERLSYPDWIIERLMTDLGEQRGIAALEAMNDAAAQVQRPDGYTQDPASQMVVDLVGGRPGELIADLCASPGGKATGLAGSGATVLASDLGVSRVKLLEGNARRYGQERVVVYVADALRPALRDGSVDRVLLDAPCSGLGVLRRRPDARWRIDAEAPERLAELQKRLIVASVPLLRPGGKLVYSVCTLTAAETLDVDSFIESEFPELEPEDVAGGPWERFGRGAVLLPQTEGTDGMCLFRYRYSR